MAVLEFRSGCRVSTHNLVLVFPPITDIWNLRDPMAPLKSFRTRVDGRSDNSWGMQFVFAYFVLHRTRTHRMTCAFAPPPLPDRLAPAAPGPQNGLILLLECAIWQPSTTESNAWPPLRTAPTTLPHFYHRGCSCCLLVVNVYPFHWPVSSVAS